MSAENLKLRLFSQSTFPAAVSPALLATSPTLNLTATVADDNTLAIRRAGGELVSSYSERGRALRAPCWKADGQLLAVACDDGSVCLLGIENTKVLHRINQTKDAVPAPSQVAYIAWARNLTGRKHLSLAHADWAAKMQRLGLDEYGVEATLGEGPGEGAHTDVDLPHALTFLEIDTSLPKLSPLPVSGGAGDDMFMFSTTASLESLFPPLKAEDNDIVDVMVLGTQDGSLHLSIYDSFVIGSFQSSASSRGPSPISTQGTADWDHQLCLHAAHPEVSTHSLLLRPPGDEKPRCLHLMTMDLGFVSYAPVNLSLLASKVTTLHKLLRYMQQTMMHIKNEYASMRELPSRFLNLIQQDLQRTKSGPTDIVQALYHTVLTGHVQQPVREWLIDSIGDRGHKRWEKAVAPSLESLRNLIHENMIPALERSTLILSRLSGITRFYDGEDIGFSDAEITRLVDIAAALNLVCHRALLAVMEELDLFRAFSSWLRITIDRVSSGTVSDEIMEREALLDPAKILRYIERDLATSPLAVYFEKRGTKPWKEEMASVQDCADVMAAVDKQLQEEEPGKPSKTALPQMGFLLYLLNAKAADILKNIASAEKRRVRFGLPVKLEISPEGNPETFDLLAAKMCRVRKDSGVDGITYVAVVTEEKPHTIGIFENKIEIIRGISGKPSMDFRQIELDPANVGRVIDIKFLSEHILVVLCQPEGQQPILLLSPYRTASSRAVTKRVEFQEDLSGFTPVRMEVLEANGSRGDVPARVCLLGQDGMSYKVFAMPPLDELTARP